MYANSYELVTSIDNKNFKFGRNEMLDVHVNSYELDTGIDNKKFKFGRNEMLDVVIIYIKNIKEEMWL
jgi:hypothetical protein